MVELITRKGYFGVASSIVRAPRLRLSHDWVLAGRRKWQYSHSVRVISLDR